MKIVRHILLAVIFLTLLLGTGLYVGIKIALPPYKIREFIQSKGLEITGRAVDVGVIEVRIFPALKLVVNDVVVSNAKGFSKTPVIKLSEVDFHLNPLSLLRFSLVIDGIKFVSPEFLYEVNAVGRNNLQGFFASAVPIPKSKPELPVAWFVKSFETVDGKATYRNVSSGREISLSHIIQHTSFELDTVLQDVLSRGKLEISELSVKDSLQPIRKSRIRVSVQHDIRLDVDGENLRLNKIDWEFGNVHAESNGWIQHFKSTPEWDVNFSAPSISLDSALKEIPAGLSPEISKLKIDGMLALQAHVRGKRDSGSTPDVDAVLKISNGAVHHSDLPQGIDHLNVEASLSQGTLDLTHMAFEMGHNPVRIEARLHHLRDTIPEFEKLSVEGTLDFEALMALAQRLGILNEEAGKQYATLFTMLRAGRAGIPRTN